MAAMGARRQRWGISIWPIFMVEPASGPGYPIYTGHRTDPTLELWHDRPENGLYVGYIQRCG